MEPEDYIDIQPWPVAELVGQLVAHVALGRRGLIELDTATDLVERETDRFELDAWARTELSAWLGTDILGIPTGDLTQTQADQCADAILVASAIGWAIRVVDTPQLRLPADGDAEQRTLDWAPGPWTPVRNAVRAARLRSDEELAAERERWEILYWRTTLFEDPTLAGEDRSALDDLVEEVSGNAAIATTDNDLALDDGTPLTALDRDALDEIQRLAEIRLRTLNWVCGFGESPASAPLFLDD